jgi:glycosyltransferase involved in cell wall biosynthesis
VLILVGGGELWNEVNAIAATNNKRFRVLPFQNQTRMPVVYRLGDAFVLPSAFGETWGLAVNEAMACGRPVIVSDRVGCAADVVDPSCGCVFPWNDFSALIHAVKDITADRKRLGAMGAAARRRAWSFDIARTEAALTVALHRVCAV